MVYYSDAATLFAIKIYNGFKIQTINGLKYKKNSNFANEKTTRLL